MLLYDYSNPLFIDRLFMFIHANSKSIENVYLGDFQSVSQSVILGLGWEVLVGWLCYGFGKPVS